MIFLAILISYLSGSVMYSYLLARYLGKDLSKVRDGNPGGSNLWRVTNWKLGLLGILLDGFKAYIPLLIFIPIFENNVNKILFYLLCISPVLGHMFSPFLKFKGGKAIASTFGVWSALTRWEVPVIMGFVYTVFSFFRKNTTPEYDSLRALSGLIIASCYVLIRFPPYFPIALVNLILLLYSHRREFLNLGKRLGNALNKS